jgi:glyoxylase-like metal-dependent hydrolase (beta-lactamase superfamily II)
MNPAGNLRYEVFVNDPPPQEGFLPDGEPKRFSPMASTLIYGDQDAVLTDPGMTEDQARALGDWVAAKGRNVTDIFVTHGHGDHWFAAGLLAERFGARVVASAGTIAQMHGSVAARPLLWDKVYTGIPPSQVTAVTVRTEDTAVGFFNAKIERYPGHLGRMILWVSASALYGVRDHPDKNAALIILNSWL